MNGNAMAMAMRMLGARLSLLGLLSAAIVPAGCASSATGTPPSPATTAPKTMSFRSDVLPIFAAHCSTTAACHGSPTGIEVFLAGSADTASSVHSRLVGIPTAELPSMPFVTAGVPAKSYLMHKLDGDQGSLDPECVTGSCGAQMPRFATLLDATTRATVRTWIEQGAPDN
jgi:hypothetical protein